ncbi:MAG: hypothetical protein HUU29_01255 [Planctomycetaceae bacterium]|nr:hypothetical protein [Planctomycetaceae bacterium]
MMRSLASRKAEYGEMLREARALNGLLSNAFMAFTDGAAIDESHTAGLNEDSAPDLSRIDDLAAGMLDQEAEAGLRADANDDIALAAELLQSDALTELLRQTFVKTAARNDAIPVSGNELVDRYLAGDLSATEQAELFSAAPDATMVGRELTQARAFEGVMRDTFGKVASGAPSRQTVAGPEIHHLTVTDDLIDRYLAGELSDHEIHALKRAAMESPAVAQRLKEASAYGKLLRDSLRGAPALPARSTRAQPGVTPSRPEARVLPVFRSRKVRRAASLIAASVVAVLAIGGFILALNDGNDTGQTGLVRLPANPAEEHSNRPREPLVNVERPNPAPQNQPEQPKQPESGVAIADNSPDNTQPKVPDAGAGAAIVERPKPDPAPSNPALEQPKPPEEVVEGPKSPEHVSPAPDQPGPDKPDDVLDNNPKQPDPTRDHGTTVRLEDSQPKPVEVSIDAGTLEARLQAFAAYRGALAGCQLKDGTFDLWGDFAEGLVTKESDKEPGLLDPPSDKGGAGNEHSSGNGAPRPPKSSGKSRNEYQNKPSNDAPSKGDGKPVLSYQYIPNKIAINALCLQALLTAGEPADSPVIRKGLDGLIKLYEDSRGQITLRELSTQDAGAMLTLFEQYYRLPMEKRSKRKQYNRPSPEHTKVIRELCKFLLDRQHKDGLWALGGTLSYGSLESPTSINHWAGREVEYDLVSGFYAVRGLEAAQRLDIQGLNVAEDVYARLATTLVKLQFSPGIEYEAFPLAWDRQKEWYIRPVEGEARLARGWTLTGDHRNASDNTVLPCCGVATSSAVYMLNVCRQYIRESKKNEDLFKGIATASDSGLNWLDATFTVKGHPHTRPGANLADNSQFHFLHLYLQSEVLAQTGHPVLGEHPWFRAGVKAMTKAFETGKLFEKNSGSETFISHAALQAANPAIRRSLAVLILDDRGLATPDGASLLAAK